MIRNGGVSHISVGARSPQNGAKTPWRASLHHRCGPRSERRDGTSQRSSSPSREIVWARPRRGPQRQSQTAISRRATQPFVCVAQTEHPAGEARVWLERDGAVRSGFGPPAMGPPKATTGSAREPTHVPGRRAGWAGGGGSDPRAGGLHPRYWPAKGRRCNLNLCLCMSGIRAIAVCQTHEAEASFDAVQVLMFWDCSTSPKVAGLSPRP